MTEKKSNAETIPMDKKYEPSTIDVIANIFNKIPKEDPTVGYGIHFNNSGFAISAELYGSGYENPNRKQSAIAEVSALVETILKKIKEGFKKETSKALSVELLGENYDVNTISNNNRQKVTFKRMYGLK